MFRDHHADIVSTQRREGRANPFRVLKVSFPELAGKLQETDVERVESYDEELKLNRPVDASIRSCDGLTDSLHDHFTCVGLCVVAVDYLPARRLR